METTRGISEADCCCSKNEGGINEICAEFKISVVKNEQDTAYTLKFFRDGGEGEARREWSLRRIDRVAVADGEPPASGGKIYFVAHTGDDFLRDNFFVDNLELGGVRCLREVMRRARELYDTIQGLVEDEGDEGEEEEGGGEEGGGEEEDSQKALQVAASSYDHHSPRLMVKAVEPEVADLPEHIRKKGKVDGAGGIAPSGINRILRDLAKIHSMDADALGFSLEPIEDNLKFFAVKLYGFTGCELERDLAKLKAQRGKDCIELELTFPYDYPYHPPSLRVKTPRLKEQTGFIINGAFCFELLTSSGWVPTVDIEMLLVQIRWLMAHGGARIDFEDSRPYTREESLRSFRAACKLHKWVI